MNDYSLLPNNIKSVVVIYLSRNETPKNYPFCIE